MALAPEEIPLLVNLLGKMEWPVPHEVFRALCKYTTTNPIELVIWNGKNEIFLVYRKDEDYDGYHMPGTVLRDNESVPQAIERLLKNEVPFYVYPAKCIGWRETPRGTGEGEDPTRHQIALLYSTNTLMYKPKIGIPNAGFFHPQSLPTNTLSHHRPLIKMAWDWRISSK